MRTSWVWGVISPWFFGGFSSAVFFGHPSAGAGADATGGTCSHSQDHDPNSWLGPGRTVGPLDVTFFFFKGSSPQEGWFVPLKKLHHRACGDSACGKQPNAMNLRSYGDGLCIPSIKQGDDLSIVYPLVICYSLLLKITIEIVDFPIEHGGSFHSYVTVYQAGYIH